MEKKTVRTRRPPRVLEWKQRDTWEPVVRRGLIGIAGAGYDRRLRERAHDLECADDSDPVFDALGAGSRAEVVEAVAGSLSREIGHFAAYHACRAEDVAAYYRDGILPLDAEQVRGRFRRLFGGRPHAVEPAALDAAIAAVSAETREGQVHVALDDRRFVDWCGHYLIYGGEFLHALAVNIPGREPSLRDELRKTGRATVLCCRLPLSCLPERETLADRMIAQHAYWVAHGPSEPADLDFTVTLKCRLPAAWIKSHYHPVRIRDPYVWRTWNDETRGYEAEE